MLIFFILVSCAFAQRRYDIVPYPQSLEERAQNFLWLNGTTIIIPNESYLNAVSFIVDLIQKSSNIYTKIVYPGDSDVGRTYINCTIDEKIENDEGYFILVDDLYINVTAKKPIGFFYAFQTLRQLLPVEIEGNQSFSEVDLVIPGCVIEDYPRFRYRGFMLDVCRHFFEFSDLLRYIDILALHKINTFHFHITEDQGWRIEIKKYPKLTSIGAWRNSVENRDIGDEGSLHKPHPNLLGNRHKLLNHHHHHHHETNHKRKEKQEQTLHHHENHLRSSPKPRSNALYGGFYTQDQARTLVEYAAARFITVLPEIEMPGHALAALAAYPEYSCTGGPFEVSTEWGVFDDVFCVTNITFDFLQDVLSEVFEIFPSDMVHVGGDECPTVRWEECPRCKVTMEENNITVHQLESYLISRIEKFVNGKGKRIIGWDEILEGGLAPNATVMSWRGVSGGEAAARSGHDAIMTPESHSYFDHSQEAGQLDMPQVYTFDPWPVNASAEEMLHIIGGQANLWTERVLDNSRVEYMMLPRLAPMSEVLWIGRNHPQKKYDLFLTRLKAGLIKRYDIWGVNYCKSNL